MKFSELGLAKRISDDLETLGFTEPTEIQVKAIPPHTGRKGYSGLG